jgi:uncharacterized protein YeeX (DUF496 family)
MAMDVIKAALSVDEFDHILEVLDRYASDSRIARERKEQWLSLAENLKRIRLSQASAYIISAYIIEAVMP